LENEVNSTPLPAPAVFDPRRRIRELLSIPERDRTDAEWDELNELEIQTAPGNRAGGNQPFGYSGSTNKPGGFHSKNRSKGKGKPGAGRPLQQGKPNNKPPRPGPA
jgi:hypothetical protein